MTGRVESERALVALRWDERELGPDRSERLREEVVAVARQLGMLGPEVLSVVPRDHHRPGFALLVIDGPAFEVAPRGLSTAKRLYENLIATFGEPVRIAADVRAGTEGSDAELEQLLDATPEGFVSLGDRLVNRLSEADVQELAARRAPHGAITYLFPAERAENFATELGVLSTIPARLPHRFVRRGDAPIGNEELTPAGLLDPEAVRGAEPLEVVLRAGRTVLVVGGPWVGKSYCAEALFRYEARTRGEERAFFQNLRTSPPNLGTDTGWRAWRASEDEATLIVDGVDEALFQGFGIDDVFESINVLEPSARARLRLIVFTRDDESRAPVRDALRDPVELRLLPLDAVEAQRELGVEGLTRALDRAGDLAAVPRPLSMEWLRTLADPAVLPEDVPQQVLLRSCSEGIDERVYRAGVSDSALLRVAERMAAALTFSELEAVPLDSRSLGLSLVASLIAGEDAEALRAFLRSAALVQRGSAYKFDSRHTQELLAARAVLEMSEPMLRELLTDSAGRLRPELVAVADAIARAAPHRSAAIQAWRDAPLPALPEAAALELIDRIAALDEPTFPLGGASKGKLARLDHPKVRDRVREHLRDRSRPLRVRGTMLHIARALEWSELVDDAIAIALDDSEPLPLRTTGAYVVWALGDSAAVERLRPLRALAVVDDEDARALAAVALNALLSQQLIAPLDAASIAPLPQPGLYDSRKSLVIAIKERMTVGDARAVLGRASGRLGTAEPAIAEGIVEKLAPVAVEKVAAEGVAWDEALATDLAAFVSKDVLVRARLESELEQRLSRDAHARELLYRAMLGEGARYVVRNTLKSEDAGWLLALAEAMPEIPEPLAEDLNLTLWWLPDGDATRRSIESLLRDRFPTRWAEWDEARRRAPERRARWEEERRARADEKQGRPRRTLVSAIDEVRAEVHESSHRLRLLSRLCFTAEWSRYTNIDGSFDLLPRELRQEIIAETRTLLARAEPSDLPEGTRFSSSVIEDAAAFRAAVLWDDKTDWLTGDLVTGWLPLVLLMDHEGDSTEVVRRSFERQRDATLGAAERCVARDACLTRHPFAARNLPVELWTERRFIAHVLGLLDDPSIALESREPLLRLMASRAERIASMSALRRFADSPSDLRLAAIGALVAIAPTEGLTRAEQAVTDVATAAAVFHVLIDSHGDMTPPDLARVPTAELLRLVCILARHVGFADTRTYGEVYSPTDEDKLQELRAHVVDLLARRPDFDDHERIFACVADGSARDALRRRVAWARDNGALARWLTELEIVAPWPSVDRVIQALDGARELRIRSVEDLFEVLREGLETTAAKDTFEYVELVRGVDTKASARAWPHERSLQAYVLLRLRNVLALSHGHEDDLIHREVQEAAGADRPDFLLAAVRTDVAPGATVELPVEVKWSHHPECVQSLTEQLGLRYVVDKGRTHGLYVVGFTGEGKHDDPVALRAALEAARVAFEQKHRVKLGVVILPCVRSG